MRSLTRDVLSWKSWQDIWYQNALEPLSGKSTHTEEMTEALELLQEKVFDRRGSSHFLEHLTNKTTMHKRWINRDEDNVLQCGMGTGRNVFKLRAYVELPLSQINVESEMRCQLGRRKWNVTFSGSWTEAGTRATLWQVKEGRRGDKIKAMTRRFRNHRVW